jgi:hypothetical protein
MAIVTADILEQWQMAKPVVSRIRCFGGYTLQESLECSASPDANDDSGQPHSVWNGLGDNTESSVPCVVSVAVQRRQLPYHGRVNHPARESKLLASSPVPLPFPLLHARRSMLDASNLTVLVHSLLRGWPASLAALPPHPCPTNPFPPPPSPSTPSLALIGLG